MHNAFILFSALLTPSLPDYRKEKIHSLSDNKLKHICWCIRTHSRTVNVNVRSLWFPSTPSTEEDPSDLDETASANDHVIRNEFRLLSEWRTAMETLDPSTLERGKEARLDIREDEMVPLTGVFNPEEILNQQVRMCLALEEEDLHLIAKTFFQSKYHMEAILCDVRFIPISFLISLIHSHSLHFKMVEI